MVVANDLVTGIFEIEDAPPPKFGRLTAPETVMMLLKVDRTIEQTKVGQAFVVPAVKRVTIKRHLRDNYPQDRFIITKIIGNDTMVRVYRLPLLKKTAK